MTWSVFFLVPTGRGTRLPQPTARQAEDVLNFCYDADKIVSLKTTEAPSFRRVCIQRVLCEREGLIRSPSWDWVPTTSHCRGDWRC